MPYEDVQRSGVPSVSPMPGTCAHCGASIYWDVRILAWRDGLIVDGNLVFLEGHHFDDPETWL